VKTSSLALLAAAGGAAYLLASRKSADEAPPSPGELVGRLSVPEKKPPAATRTAVYRGSKSLLQAILKNEEPILIMAVPLGSAVVMAVTATVMNGIRHSGSGSGEVRHTGVNACGRTFFYGTTSFGALLNRRKTSYPQYPFLGETPWFAVPGCPDDGSGMGLNLQFWLRATLLYDLSGNLVLRLWNYYTAYRGNIYDVRIEWAITPS